MIVYFMCIYYPQWAHKNLAERTQDQWDAFKFCRAVKSKNINGTMCFPWNHRGETDPLAGMLEEQGKFLAFLLITCAGQYSLRILF